MSDDSEANDPTEDAGSTATPLGGGAGVHVGSADDPQAEGAPINFGGFTISLATNAYINMGLAPDPVSGKTHRDLVGAKQIVDILEMLQTKTKGNLDAEEERLLSSLVYELKMAFVDAK